MTNTAAAAVLTEDVITLDDLSTMVAETVRQQTQTLMAEIESLRAMCASLATQVAVRPQKGEPGKSVTIEAVQPLLTEMVAAIPRARDGRDGLDGTSVTLADLEPVLERMVENRFVKIPPPVNGRDGRDGVDGRSVTAEELQAAVVREVGKIPVPVNGKDGRDGIDGRSVTLEEVTPVIERLVDNRFAKIPPPVNGKDGRDGIDGKDGIDGRSVSADELAPVIERVVSRHVARIPPPQDGKDGKDGRNGRDAPTVEEVEQYAWPTIKDAMGKAISASVTKAVEALPLPKDGKDGVNGKDGASVTLDDVMPTLQKGVDHAKKHMLDALDSWKPDLVERVAQSLDEEALRGAPGKDADPEHVKALVAEAVERIPKPVDGRDGRDGKDGKDGRDGKSVSPEELAPVLTRMVSATVAALPPPRDGRDGKNGLDGTSVAVADVLPHIERAARAEVAKLPTPRDGKDGRDGRDGIDGRDAAEITVLPAIVEGRTYAKGTYASFDGGLFVRSDNDWKCIADGVKGLKHERNGDREHVITFTFASGRTESIKWKSTEQIYRETWEERAYEHGDTVTWGGCMWAAIRNLVAGDKPGISDGWRLCVKQGRPAPGR